MGAKPVRADGCFPEGRGGLAAALVSLVLVFYAAAGWTADTESGGAAARARVEAQWGGHLKLRGSVAWPRSDTLYGELDTNPWLDGNGEFRLKNKLFFGKEAVFETHYEALVTGGDTRRRTDDLALASAGSTARLFVVPRQLQDDRRLLDLTSTIAENDSTLVFHRLDRLSLTLIPSWGLVRVGRQAVTWGNGLVFNPMDLFNPFAPVEIDRDYKVGDDMALVQALLGAGADCQLLYVPRRNPDGGDVGWNQSSLAGKTHFGVAAVEWDLMAAHHYGDQVVGIGSSGYLGDAAWRADGTWTFLEDGGGFAAFVANLDCSWTFLGKNWYGLAEFYFNGLGASDPGEALEDQDLRLRLARGELFTLGRFYLAGSQRVELHPLVNVFLTAIVNLGDPSGILQPRIVWDAAQNLQLTGGLNLFWGGPGTEYGGVVPPDSDLRLRSPESAYLWVSYFF